MKTIDSELQYVYRSGHAGHAHEYLWPALSRFLRAENPRRLFELGCGNGAMAVRMASQGVEVVGIDSSESGIALAKAHLSTTVFEVASAYDELGARFGQFPAVVSLEVVEHLFDPRRFASVVFDLLEPGGVAFISTPYHGYLKNLALAVAGRWDSHLGPLWDGGHIKFWSISSLGQLLAEAGFVDVSFQRVGRIAPLAKSMIAVARKPVA